MRRWILLSLALAACAEPPPPGSCSALSQVTVYVDADGDGHGDPATADAACAVATGFVVLGDDCDDADPASLPGAAEQCDGRDNDCDSTIDEGMVLTTYFSDYDGDGVGNADYPAESCAQPVGYVAEAGDCNDANAAVNPFAAEVCNGLDDDCDTRVDDDDASLDTSTTATFYADADNDGAGDPLVTAEACAAPARHVANADDCDDTNRDLAPGAGETCNGLDDDCDGLWDESDPDLDRAGLETFWFDGDSDGAGDPGLTVEACFEPLFFVDNDGDCDDTEPLLIDPAPWLEDTDGDGVGAGSPSPDLCAPPAAGWVLAALGLDCAPDDPTIWPGAEDVCEDTIDQDCDGRDATCGPVLSDTCAEATALDRVASGTTALAADLTGLGDDLNLAAGTCTRGATNGTDAFVAIDVLAGQLVTVTHNNDDNAAVYLVEDCLDATSCVAGADNDPDPGATEIVQWWNTSPNDATVYAAFDCAGATCGYADAEVRVAYDTPVADTCADAQTWTPLAAGSLSMVASVAGFSDDLSLGVNGCTGYPSDGSEGFLPVLIGAGETIEATYRQKTADASLYLLGDCNLGNSCLVGEDNTIAGGNESIAWTNNTGGDVQAYLVLDCYAAACNAFELSLDIR